MLDSGSDALSRKANAARLAREAEGMSVGKAFRRGLARGAETLWNLALVARDRPMRLLDQRAAEAQLAEFDLLMLLEGPEDAIGFAAFDRQTLTALIEVRTMGVVENEPPETRALTGTDAAICAPLVERALKLMTDTLAGSEDVGLVQGFRYGARVESARTAGTVMTAPRFHRLRADVELGGGIRQGQVMFLLPAAEEPATDAAGGSDPGPHAEFMMGLPVRCTAILARIELPASAFERLRPGDLLELPPNPLSQAELRAGRHTRLSRAVLGQLGGRRALRLTDRIAGSARGSMGEDGPAAPVPAGLGPPVPVAPTARIAVDGTVGATATDPGDRKQGGTEATSAGDGNGAGTD